MKSSTSRFSPRNEFFAFLNGFGQIMLQSSAIAGMLFLAGIGMNSAWMAVAGIAGALAGIITGRVCMGNSDDLGQGLYGYNGALVGIALLFFYGPSLSCFALILLGAALSSVLMRAMLRWADHLPPFTAPFVLSAWAMLMVAGFAGMERIAVGDAPSPGGDIAAVLRGLAQVMFQDSWITGIVFFAGLALASRQAAAWALIGSAVGLVAARGLGYSPSLAEAGLFGFNAALAAIALGGRFRDNAMLPLAGILLSTVIAQWFLLAGLPALTAPFVLSSWLVILAVRWRERIGSSEWSH